MVCAIGFNASYSTSIPAPPIVQRSPTRFYPLATPVPEAVLNFVHIPKTGGSSLERCLQVWCAQNSMRCFHTFHHGHTVGSWLGKPTKVRNGLDALRALNQSERDEIRVVYGHQESGLSSLFARPVQSVAVLRQPEERWLSELAYVTRNTMVGALPPECLPRDEMATYLCYGSDFRKGEIVPPESLRNEAYYAQRRAPNAEQLAECLRNYTLLLTTEADSHFAAVGQLLNWHFPLATAKFACNERKNVSPRAQKEHLRANLSTKHADALERMNTLDLALWHRVQAHEVWS